MSNFGNKLKHIRQSKFLTQKQLAELTGLSEISIRKYENGDRNPKTDALIKICDALDVALIDFVDTNSRTIIIENPISGIINNSEELIMPKKAKHIAEDKINLPPSVYKYKYNVELPLKRKRNLLKKLIEDIADFPFDINNLSDDKVNEVYNFILEMLKIKLTSIEASIENK